MGSFGPGGLVVLGGQGTVDLGCLTVAPQLPAVAAELVRGKRSG